MRKTKIIKKLAILLSALGDDAQDVCDMFVLIQTEERDWKNVLQKFEKYCVPKNKHCFPEIDV